LAFIQGISAFKRYSNNSKAHLVISTTINKDDIGKKRIPACEKNQITLLSVGRLAREKGHIYLLRAFKQLKKEIGNISLKIVGGGNLHEEFLKWIKENDFENEIELSGRITPGQRLFNIYRSSDIFILPSISEGTPKVILEAMGSGLPVIATEVGGVPTLIKHKINGYLVPRQNEKVIAEAIKLLIKDKELRDRLIETGYEFAEQHTNKKEMDKILESVRNEYPKLFKRI